MRVGPGRGVLVGLVAGTCLASPARAELVEGEAWQLSASPGASAQSIHFRVENCAGLMRSEWRARDGALLAWDEVETAGGQLIRYRLVRPNLGQDFTRTVDALPMEQDDDAGPLLAGPMLIEYARAQLATLRRGRMLRVRYLVAETLMLVPLRLRATSERPGRTSITVDAAQIWMRPLVPDAVLDFDEAARFVGMQGQILPQVGSRQRPEPIAARLRVLGSRSTSDCHN